MKTVIMVQARMGSTRLPGKAMKRIVGVPTIGIILKRLKKTREANKIIVATSKNRENKVLLEYLQKIKANFVNGKIYYGKVVLNIIDIVLVFGFIL